MMLFFNYLVGKTLHLPAAGRVYRSFAVATTCLCWRHFWNVARRAVIGYRSSCMRPPTSSLLLKYNLKLGLNLDFIVQFLVLSRFLFRFRPCCHYLRTPQWSSILKTSSSLSFSLIFILKRSKRLTLFCKPLRTTCHPLHTVTNRHSTLLHSNWTPSNEASHLLLCSSFRWRRFWGWRSNLKSFCWQWSRTS